MILDTVQNLAQVLRIISLGISFTEGSISSSDDCLEIAAAQGRYLTLGRLVLSWEGTLSPGLSDAGKAALAFLSVQSGGTCSPDISSRISTEELAFLNKISRSTYVNVALANSILTLYFF